MSIRIFPVTLMGALSILLLFPTSPLQTATQGQIQISRQESDVQDEFYQVTDYLSYIHNHSNLDKVPLPLVMAVIKAESNFDPSAISRKGALGLMQLMPVTAMEEYNRFGLDVAAAALKKNLLIQPELNLLLGIKYIKTLSAQLSGIKSSKDRQLLVIAAYNAGMKRVKRSFGCIGTRCLIWRVNNSGNRFFQKSIRKLPLETRRYLRTVDKAFRYYSQVFYKGNTTAIAANKI